MPGGHIESPRAEAPSQGPLREASTPPQITQPRTDNVDLTTFIPPSTLRADLTPDHLRRLFAWENSAWDEARPFEVTTSQIGQELDEASDVYTKIAKGQASLADEDTMHHLREEIGDGEMATAGLIRHLLERDDDKVIEVIASSLNQPDRTRGGPESAVGLYLVSGYRLLRTIPPGVKMEQMSKSFKNDLIQRAGGFMKAGLVALEKLDAEPGHVINSKVGTNRIKYSRERLKATGSMQAAKQDWQRRQLHVAQGGVIIPKELEEAA